VEECAEALDPSNGPGSVYGAAVVVARVEVGVVVPALELQACLQNLRGDVRGRGGQIGEESCGRVSTGSGSRRPSVMVPAAK
jgi:hypothetical protein